LERRREDHREVKAEAEQGPPVVRGPVLRWGAAAAGRLGAGDVGPVLLFRFVDPPPLRSWCSGGWTPRTRTRRVSCCASSGCRARASAPKPAAPRSSPRRTKKFAEHFGFDVQAIEDAVGGAPRGQVEARGEHATQQVAKNLFLWPGKSFVRKALEAYFTVLLELLWSKARIPRGAPQTSPSTATACTGWRRPADSTWARRPPRSHGGSGAAGGGLPSPRNAPRVTAPTPKVRQRSQWVLAQMEHVNLTF